ncbi:MAG: hypothetical protein IT424_01210 [Pirellulales bacterium]|nr:hypothetical protein [Pirellulales bacterium]
MRRLFLVAALACAAWQPILAVGASDESIDEPPLVEIAPETPSDLGDEGPTGANAPPIEATPPDPAAAVVGAVVTVPPATMAGYRGRNGETIAFELVGSTEGAIWGDGVYSDDSSLSTAAVHAGLLKPGEKGVVRVTVLPGKEGYSSVARNGVESYSYTGSWMGSFTFPDAAGAATDAPPTPPQAPAPEAPSSPGAPTQPTPPPSGAIPAQSVEVWALSVSRDSDGVGHGHCHPMRVSIGGHAPGEVRVGFFESEVGASGPQWRAAGWTAALTAAQISDFDPRTMQAAFDITGWIDGPSGGGLMAVGVLAAARGDKLRQDAAMTGTINPDGIIGPVGGVGFKIRGAADAGKKLVLIPAGLVWDSDSGVVYKSLGDELGVEVVPVLDIYTAYLHMTGVELPRPPAGDVAPTPKSVNYAMLDVSTEWAQRGIKALDNIPDYYTDEVRASLRKSATYKRQAVNLNSEGEYAANLHDAVLGTAADYCALELARCELTYQSRGLRAMIARVQDNGWLTAEIEGAAIALRNAQIGNVEQLLGYLEACDLFLAGASYRAAALDVLERLPAKSDDEQYIAGRRAALYQIRALVSLKLVHDYLKILSEYEGPAVPAQAPIEELADFYRRAGEANEEVFESLVIAPTARSSGLTPGQVRYALALNDEEYDVLLSAGGVTPHLDRWFSPGLQRDYASLAAGLFSYCRSAMLVAKYYSLDAEMDDRQQIIRLRRERTFGDWLAGSEDEAQRSIHRLQQRGISSAVCVQYLDIARVLRNRDLASRIEALSYLFRTNVTARVMWRLAGTGADQTP